MDEHIDEFNLPKNPDFEVLRKLRNDPRARSFQAKHGELFQVEVDALQAYAPEEFRTMVLDSVDQFFDESIYDKLLAEHSEDKISHYLARNFNKFPLIVS